MTAPSHAPAERAPSLPQLVLSAAHLAEVRELLQRHLPEAEVRAFGSRAGGNPKPASDLDLLVISETPVNPRSIALLADAFAESDLPFKVDLVDARTATPSFRARALENSVIVQPAASLRG